MAESSTSVPNVSSTPAPQGGGRLGALQYSFHPPAHHSSSDAAHTRAKLASLLPHQPPPSSSQPVPLMSSSADLTSHPTADAEEDTHPVHELAGQVGGHAGVMSSDDGSLVIKPTLPHERAFYEDLAASAPRGEEPAEASSPFEALRPWVPKYYGTLRLEGRTSGSLGEGGETVLEDVPEVKNKDEFFLDLEPSKNVSDPFKRANVLDVKLGTVLYEATATPEKRQRMEETARNTTSLESGVRLTGFQVWDASTGKHDVTPKSYGKSIKVADLPNGAAKFFAQVGDDGKGPGVRQDLLIPVVKGVLDQVQEIRRAVAETEMRMVGGSLLILWEGDEERLEAALEKKLANQLTDREAEAQAAGAGAGVESDTTSLASDVDAISLGGAGAGSDSSGESGGGRRRLVVGPPYVVRVIDFAHTHAVPGQGPDEGVLKGIDTVVALLRGRLEELINVGDSAWV